MTDTEQGTTPQDDNPTGATLTQEQLDALLRRDEHAQEHIRVLEQEAKERREMLEQLTAKLEAIEKEKEGMASLEELLGRSRQAGAPANEDSSATTPAQSTDDLAALVEAKLKEVEQAKERQRRMDDAVGALKAIHGEAFETVLEEKATAMGMSKEQALDLAVTHPAVWKATFAQTPPKSPSSRGDINTTAMAMMDDGTQVTAKELYNKDRNSFFSPENYERLAKARKLRGK